MEEALLEALLNNTSMYCINIHNKKELLGDILLAFSIQKDGTFLHSDSIVDLR